MAYIIFPQIFGLFLKVFIESCLYLCQEQTPWNVMNDSV